MNNPITDNTAWRNFGPSYARNHLWMVVDRDTGKPPGIKVDHGVKAAMLISCKTLDESRHSRQVARRNAALLSQQNPGKTYDVVLYTSFNFGYKKKPYALDRSYMNGRKVLSNGE